MLIPLLFFSPFSPSIVNSYEHDAGYYVHDEAHAIAGCVFHDEGDDVDDDENDNNEDSVDNYVDEVDDNDEEDDDNNDEEEGD